MKENFEMKRLALLAALVAAGTAHAATDCKTTITRITASVGAEPHFYAMTAGGVGFDIPDTPNYKTAIAMANLSMTMGTEVVLRFKADGLNCVGPPQYRTDLVMISAGNSTPTVDVPR